MNKLTVNRIVGQIHLWLGLTSGLVVLILGITGCLYAFEQEIKAWVYANKLEVNSTSTKHVTLSQNLEAAQQGLGKAFPIQGVIIKNTPQSSLLFRHFELEEEATGIWFWDEINSNFSVYVNPYTSEILKVENATFEFFNMVLWLHWSLLLKNDLGQPIVGLATLIFIVLVITGLVLWWPKNIKAKKQRTWFRWKSDTRWRRKNYDLHNIVGFYSMFLVIFIALTGLVWAFSWFDHGVQWIAKGGRTIEKEKLEVRSTPSALASIHPLDMAHHYLRNTHPEAEVFYLNLPQDSTGTIKGFADYVDNSRDIILQFDQYSGELLHAGTSWEEKSNGEKLRAYNYNIHTGAIGGLVGKTIAFFLALFSASQPVTGFIIWWGRRNKRNEPGLTKSTNRNQGISPRPVLRKTSSRETVSTIQSVASENR
ncbi:MAG: PepSY-associated TM helix domain-containing protein [Bacteroidota bacterium]